MDPASAQLIGIAACLIPFVFSMSSSNSVTIDGEVVTQSYRDAVAIVCGVVAALCGVVAMMMGTRAPRSPRLLQHIAIGLALVGGGTYQVLRGCGQI